MNSTAYRKTGPNISSESTIAKLPERERPAEREARWASALSRLKDGRERERLLVEIGKEDPLTMLAVALDIPLVSNEALVRLLTCYEVRVRHHEFLSRLCQAAPSKSLIRLDRSEEGLYRRLWTAANAGSAARSFSESFSRPGRARLRSREAKEILAEVGLHYDAEREKVRLSIPTTVPIKRGEELLPRDIEAGYEAVARKLSKQEDSHAVSGSNPSGRGLRFQSISRLLENLTVEKLMAEIRASLATRGIDAARVEITDRPGEVVVHPRAEPPALLPPAIVSFVAPPDSDVLLIKWTQRARCVWRTSATQAELVFLAPRAGSPDGSWIDARAVPAERCLGPFGAFIAVTHTAPQPAVWLLDDSGEQRHVIEGVVVVENRECFVTRSTTGMHRLHVVDRVGQVCSVDLGTGNVVDIAGIERGCLVLRSNENGFLLERYEGGRRAFVTPIKSPVSGFDQLGDFFSIYSGPPFVYVHGASATVKTVPGFEFSAEDGDWGIGWTPDGTSAVVELATGGMIDLGHVVNSGTARLDQARAWSVLTRNKDGTDCIVVRFDDGREVVSKPLAASRAIHSSGIWEAFRGESALVVVLHEGLLIEYEVPGELTLTARAADGVLVNVTVDGESALYHIDCGGALRCVTSSADPVLLEVIDTGDESSGVLSSLLYDNNLFLTDVDTGARLRVLGIEATDKHPRSYVAVVRTTDPGSEPSDVSWLSDLNGKRLTPSSLGECETFMLEGGVVWALFKDGPRRTVLSAATPSRKKQPYTATLSSLEEERARLVRYLRGVTSVAPERSRQDPAVLTLAPALPVLNELLQARPEMWRGSIALPARQELFKQELTSAASAIFPACARAQAAHRRSVEGTTRSPLAKCTKLTVACSVEGGDPRSTPHPVASLDKPFQGFLVVDYLDRRIGVGDWGQTTRPTRPFYPRAGYGPEFEYTVAQSLGPRPSGVIGFLLPEGARLDFRSVDVSISGSGKVGDHLHVGQTSGGDPGIWFTEREYPSDVVLRYSFVVTNPAGAWRPGSDADYMATRETDSAWLAGLSMQFAELPSEWRAEVAQAMALPPLLRAEYLAERWRASLWYDREFGEVREFVRGMPESDRFEFFRRRLVGLRRRGLVSEDVPDTVQRAMVCADAAVLGAAIFRAAGLPAGITRGYLSKGATISTTDSHVEPFVILRSMEGGLAARIFHVTPPLYDEDRTDSEARAASTQGAIDRIRTQKPAAVSKPNQVPAEPRNVSAGAKVKSAAENVSLGVIPTAEEAALLLMALEAERYVPAGHAPDAVRKVFEVMKKPEAERIELLTWYARGIARRLLHESKSPVDAYRVFDALLGPVSTGAIRGEVLDHLRAVCRRVVGLG